MKKAVLIMVVSSFLLAGAGSFPTWKLAGESGVWAMATAGLICLPCALVSLVPLGYVLAKNMTDWWGQAALASMTLRMFSTLVLSFLASWILPVPLLGFLVWVLLFYMFFLIFETALVIRLVNAQPQPTGPDALAIPPQVTGGIS